MDEWHVSGSESDPGSAEEGGVDIGGIKMNPEKLRDMLQMIEKRKTLQLDALTGIRRKEHKNKKGRQRAQSSAKDEVSETASEIPSTASNVELRDTSRSSTSAFDYFNDEPLAPASKPSTLKRVGAPKRDRKLARLECIMADLRKEKRVCRDRASMQEDEEEEEEEEEEEGAWGVHFSPRATQTRYVGTNSNSFSLPAFGSPDSPGAEVNTPTMPHKTVQLCSPELQGFDSDEDGEEALENGDNIKHQVLSQITKVEKLLDAEGLSAS